MGTLLIPAALLLAVAAWFFFWQRHARRFKISGYTSPETSWFGRLVFSAVSRLVTFLTVGPVTVVGKNNVPKKVRILVVGNHQVESDFAMARRAAGRHLRLLGAAAQFPGVMALAAAWLGVIPVTYKTKEERAQGEAACIKYLGGKRKLLRLSCTGALILSAVLAGVVAASVWFGFYLAAVLAGLGLCLLAGLPGSDRALLIAPQGALMPDNQLLREEFRPGAVRVSRAAAATCDERVLIVPMAVYYKRDPKDAHWTHRFLKKTRSMFHGLRNPVHWNPLFKLDLDTLGEDERAHVEREREVALKAYRRSYITSYGGVVVVGKPIDPSTLAADPVDAIEQIRLKIAELLEVAKKH